MARVSKENSALSEELARLKAARAVANTALPAAIDGDPEGPKAGGDIVVEKPSQQVCEGTQTSD